MFATFIGIASAVIAGVLNGSFATPMKRTVKWEWENTWLMWAVWALIIVPWLLAFATVPQLSRVYSETSSWVIVRTILLGAGWGAGAITFGLGMYMVGLSLGFSIIIGITSVTGALIPMLILSPDKIVTSGGMVIIFAMLVNIVGVVLCGSAGMLKEKTQEQKTEGFGGYKFKWGLVVCITSGILNAMLNLALVSGGEIAKVAKEYVAETAADFRVGNAIWAVALSGAFITNLVYCGGLLLRKGTWKNYRREGTSSYWFWTFLMGLIWMSGVALYGASATTLGDIGKTVAWIILMATTVLIGNVWGILSGEWTGTAKKARQRMAQGLLLLIVSIVLVSVGQYLTS